MNLNIKKNKILFISNKKDRKLIGGRQNLTELNIKILKDVFKKNFFNFEIKKKKIKSLKDILLALTGNIDGINDNKIKIIKDLIIKNNIKYIFVDGSNLGKISRKLNSKDTKIITFCHNVETNFFLKKFKIFINLRNFYILLVNFLAEFQTVLYSDFLIFLNKRDKLMMKKYFLNKKSFIIPMSIQDRFKKINNDINKNKYLIFVGSDFFGNFTGLDWYIKNIVKNIDFKTYIIGKNLFKKKYKDNSKVKFMGYVKNLDKFYKKALFTVAPVFQGSGMKTKVAESLMYGKYIVGLEEAFIGYEKFENKIGYKCKDANSFIKSINTLAKKKHLYYEPSLRKIYLKNFSDYSMKNSYKIFFGRI